MKITFIYHSSFLIEFDGYYMLFDYFKGELPVIDSKKPLYVFSSHSHKDHFDSIIFDKFKNAHFILSNDICKNIKSDNKNITCVYANKDYIIDDIKITTLNSTDMGVAYLIECEDKTIFHSGDLHFWVWQEETKQYNNNMTANYKREIDKLKNINIDTAFIPLDPRQGDWYYKGMKYFIDNVKVKYVFPMHCWEKYSIVDKFIYEGYNKNNTTIFNLTEGMTYGI